MKNNKTTTAIFVLVVLVAGVTTPAAALTPNSSLSVEELPPLPQNFDDQGVSNEELVELSTQQSAEEIQAIINSGVLTVSLVDDDGTVLAIAEAEMPRAAREISIDSPHTCESRPSSACIYTTTHGATPYKGTGNLNINVKNVSVVAAGAIATTFTRNTGTQYFVPQFTQKRMKYAANIVRIAR